MKDVQSQKDQRNVYLNQVGINKLRHPLIVKDKRLESQKTVAEFDISVSLAMEDRGTHMSRFVEIVNEIEYINLGQLESLLTKLRDKLHAEAAYISISFPYFIEKLSPVTKSKGLIDVDCEMVGKVDHKNNFEFTLSVTVPVQTLCPCSKEISESGAHNQRAYTTVSINTKRLIWIEDIVNLIEKCASTPLYPVLKRPDEKYVTEFAYNNPKFVEDLTRDCVVALREIEGIDYYEVYTESEESIHNHNAYAYARKDIDE